MELLSEECVPAIAAEVDIAIGSKRKRGSVTSKSKRPRKSSQAAKQDKENQAPGSLTLGSTKSSTSISGAAEADTVSTMKRRVLRKAEKKQVADVVLKVDKADLVASVLQYLGPGTLGRLTAYTKNIVIIPGKYMHCTLEERIS